MYQLIQNNILGAILESKSIIEFYIKEVDSSLYFRSFFEQLSYYLVK